MKSRTLTIIGVLACALGCGALGADVVSIWGGARGTIVLKSDGTVWTWGANFGGKLGLGVNATTLDRVLVPSEVHGPSNIDYLHSITAIMGGEVHNVALKSDGTLWSWGNNFQGGLGDGTTNDSSVPIQAGLGAIPPLISVTKLGGRTYFNLAVKSDGTVWAWGMGGAGQMGNGGTTNCLSPVPVSSSQPGGSINGPAQVSCGYTYGVALLTNGTVWEWGNGFYGELGQGPNIFSAFPAPVIGLSNVAAISSGWKHVLARQSNGTVWAWGKNVNGELGDGTTVNRSNAVRVLNLSNIVAVSGGDYNSIALRADGTVWKWGLNDVGELGLGTNDNIGTGPAGDTMAHSLPVQIPLDASSNAFGNVVKVSNRDYHNIAVKADGSVWMWGANDQGQCGDSTTNFTYRPVRVAGLGARVGLPLNAKPSVQPGQVDLRWNSATGEYFSVEYSTNLASGFTVVAQSNILATPPMNTISVPATNAPRYYRLKF